MIKRFFNRLARLLHAAAALCERAAAKCKESKCKDPLCKESKCDDPTPYRRGRLKFLLSLDRLSKDEARELDELASAFPGPVIFLDEKEKDL